MNTKKLLQNIGLDSDNSVVIGSGILEALEIRKSHDIDAVVTNDVYNFLKQSGKFTISSSLGHEILHDDTFEIGTCWDVLEKQYEFIDFKDKSVVISEVRYNTLEFLLRVKKSWVSKSNPRQKDIDDIKLIENYIKDVKKQTLV